MKKKKKERFFKGYDKSSLAGTFNNNNSNNNIHRDVHILLCVWRKGIEVKKRQCFNGFSAQSSLPKLIIDQQTQNYIDKNLLIQYSIHVEEIKSGFHYKINEPMECKEKMMRNTNSKRSKFGTFHQRFFLLNYFYNEEHI